MEALSAALHRHLRATGQQHPAMALTPLPMEATRQHTRSMGPALRITMVSKQMCAYRCRINPDAGSRTPLLQPATPREHEPATPSRFATIFNAVFCDVLSSHLLLAIRQANMPTRHMFAVFICFIAIDSRVIDRTTRLELRCSPHTRRGLASTAVSSSSLKV